MSESDSGRAAPVSGVPVWARTRRRSSGNPLLGLIVGLLALLGAASLGLAVKERSAAAAGARIDGWIALGRGHLNTLLGKPAAATPAALVAPPAKPVAAKPVVAQPEAAQPQAAPAPPMTGTSGGKGG